MKCDICGNTNTYIKDHKHNYERGNIKYSFISKRRFCSNCNNLVYDAELDNEASKKAISSYTEIVGINPIEIIKLRKSYNLTQEQFAKIIGCAKKTLISYEQGKSIPNDIYLVTLKTLLDNPDIIRFLINSNKERYSSQEYEIINNKISVNYHNNFLNKIAQELTEYNGYTELSLDKIKNLILILSKSGILKTKLLKEMFYVDFISYKERGCSITGLAYTKYPYGPVPSNFENILNNLEKQKYINYEIIYNDKGYEYHKIQNIENFNLTFFSKDELKIIEKVEKYFQNFNSKQIVDFSHKEKAFLETEMFKSIDYSYAFDIDRV